MTAKPKKLFDHLNAIYADQTAGYFDGLDDVERKDFNTYMINRFLSMNPRDVPVVNLMQQYYNSFDARSTYLFYSRLIPKGKQFNKYVKGATEEKIERWLLELVATYFEVSTKESLDYVTLMMQTEQGKNELREICVRFNIDKKKLKKVDL
jgi:hypothetical protein